jgi:ATP-dependent protease ClpP protease subunit
MHNIGSIESIANVAFLAGSKRLACPNTRFMFHDFTWTYGQQETLDRDHMRERAESLDADANQFIELFQLRSKLTKDLFEERQLLRQPSFVSPDQALEWGIVEQVVEAMLPSGVPILNVDY